MLGKSYYRWVIVVVAALAMSGTLPGRTHGLGLITKPLLEDLGISEVAFGWVNFWSILLGAAFCWPVGRVMDRFGTRRVLTLVSAALGLSVIAMGHVTGIAGLFLILILVRGLGQGALSVISTAMVGKWFTRQIGMAMGVFAVLLAIGFLCGVIGVGVAVQQSGWRVAWRLIGWAQLVGLAPIAYLLTREPPVDQPLSDLEKSAGLSLPDSESDHLEDLSLKAALGSPAFWTFSLASCLFGFIWSAITLYNEFILDSRGFGQFEFYCVMGVITVVGLAANLVGGWLAGRWPLGRLLGTGMGMLGLSLLAFPWVQNMSQLMLYAVAMGSASGLITVVHFTFYRQAFGRTHLGQIQGFFQVLSVFTSALGPLVIAWGKEEFGSYVPVFLVVAPLTLALGAVAAWVPMPERTPKLAVEGNAVA